MNNNMLHDNSLLFTSLFSNTIDGILVTDTFSSTSDNITIKYANKIICDLFLLEQDKIVGKSLDMLPQSNRILEILQKLTNENTEVETLRIPLLQFGPLNNLKDVELDVTPIIENKKLNKWALTFRNISELVNDIAVDLYKDKNFNKAVLESSPDCLKILDNSGKLKFMNYNGLCHMEIDDFSDFEDKYWWNLWGKANEGLVKNAVEEALSGEIAQFSAYCPTAKGTPKWWDVSVIPVLSDDNGVNQILSVSRDITSQKETEEEIQLLNKSLEEKVDERTRELSVKNIQLEAINTEMELFNRVASHDLQEPLRKIQMFTNRIIESNSYNPDSEKLFKKIIASTERMRNLIESIQQFSVSNDTNAKKEFFSLQELITNILDDFDDNIIEKKAVISYSNLPVIKGFKELLNQVFTNLIENSFKYSKPNIPVIIDFKVDVVSADDIDFITLSKLSEFYKITVSDNGIGFDNELSEKIFEPFQRLHAKNEYSGTGIGLAICKNVMIKHLGAINANSVLGKGTDFILYFPKHPVK